MSFPSSRCVLRCLSVCAAGLILLICSFSTICATDFGIDLPTVSKIEILGNRSIDDGKLKKRMRTKEARFYHILKKPKFREDFLRRDVETLKSYYHKNGFFSVKVTVEAVEREEKANKVHIRIMVNEGPQTVVRSLEFSGQEMLEEKVLRKGLQLTEGKPYNPNLLEVDHYTIFSKFFEKGYLGAKVYYDLNIDSIEVDLSWKISPEEPVRIDSITIGGNQKVKTRLIERELIFGTGEYFDLKRVVESKQNLYDTGYFTLVNIEPTNLDMESRKADLGIEVRERSMGYIEAGVGVGNITGNRVFAEWGQRNLLGRGYGLNLKSSFAFWLFDQNDYDLTRLDFKTKYLRNQGTIWFPHVVDTWNTLSFRLFHEYDATVDPIVVRAWNLSASVSRRFTRRISLVFGYALEYVKRYEYGKERSQSEKRYIEALFTRDTRDFYFNPMQGHYFSAKGKLAGGIFGGEDDFYSFVVAFRRYIRIGKQTVFAYRLRGGYAEAYGDSKDTGVPIEDHFFAGGTNSVRGYKENSLGPVNVIGDPLGGNYQLLTNFELRFPIPYLAKYNFGAVVFLDGGNVWESMEDVSVDQFDLISDENETTYLDYRWGIGFGLRYNTPVGPIRLDFGYPLKKTTDIDYDYLVHISLGQIF